MDERESLVRILPSSADLYLARITKKVDLKFALNFFRPLESWEKVGDYIRNPTTKDARHQMSVKMCSLAGEEDFGSMPKTGKILFNLTKVDKMKNLPIELLRLEHDTMRNSIEPYTPFSVLENLSIINPLGTVSPQVQKIDSSCEHQSRRAEIGYINARGIIFSEGSKKTGNQYFPQIPHNEVLKTISYILGTLYSFGSDGERLQISRRDQVVDHFGIGHDVIEGQWTIFRPICAGIVALLEKRKIQPKLFRNELSLIYWVINENYEIFSEMQRENFDLYFAYQNLVVGNSPTILSKYSDIIDLNCIEAVQHADTEQSTIDQVMLLSNMVDLAPVAPSPVGEVIILGGKIDCFKKLFLVHKDQFRDDNVKVVDKINPKILETDASRYVIGANEPSSEFIVAEYQELMRAFATASKSRLSIALPFSRKNHYPAQLVAAFTWSIGYLNHLYFGGRPNSNFYLICTNDVRSFPNSISHDEIPDHLYGSLHPFSRFVPRCNAIREKELTSLTDLVVKPKDFILRIKPVSEYIWIHKCDICGEKFRTTNALSNHLGNKHQPKSLLKHEVRAKASDSDLDALAIIEDFHQLDDTEKHIVVNSLRNARASLPEPKVYDKCWYCLEEKPKHPGRLCPMKPSEDYGPGADRNRRP